MTQASPSSKTWKDIISDDFSSHPNFDNAKVIPDRNNKIPIEIELGVDDRAVRSVGNSFHRLFIFFNVKNYVMYRDCFVMVAS